MWRSINVSEQSLRTTTEVDQLKPELFSSEDAYGSKVTKKLNPRNILMVVVFEHHCVTVGPIIRYIP